MPGVSPVSESLGLMPALIAASTQPESVLGAAGWADVAGRSGTLGLEGLASSLNTAPNEWGDLGQDA